MFIFVQINPHSMNFHTRKQLILSELERRGSAEVRELAGLIGASDMTIRRDLTQLADEGLLCRTHGGAMRPELAKQTIRFDQKTANREEQKEYICQLAAQEIQPGETILLDCGSTVFRLCPHIRHLPIQVITNSLPIVAALLHSQVRVNVVGGELDHDRQAMHGLMAQQHLSQYRADRAFIGVDGLSLANGLSANSEKEANMALSLAKQAKHVYLLCDSSKLERDKYLAFAPLSLAHTLITDREAPPELVEAYRQAGIWVRP